MTLVHISRWTQRFTAWQRFAEKVSARARLIDEAAQVRGWNLAASVGIPRCMCSLHNAAIDDTMNGWCHNNPHRLATAKRAAYMVNRWRASDLARQIIAEAYRTMVADE